MTGDSPTSDPPSRTDRGIPVSRYDHDRTELDALLTGLPTYRTEQLWQGLYSDLADPDDITTLPATLRSELVEQFPAALHLDHRSVSDSGEDRKSVV